MCVCVCAFALITRQRCAAFSSHLGAARGSGVRGKAGRRRSLRGWVLPRVSQHRSPGAPAVLVSKQDPDFVFGGLAAHKKSVRRASRCEEPGMHKAGWGKEPKEGCRKTRQSFRCSVPDKCPGLLCLGHLATQIPCLNPRKSIWAQPGYKGTPGRAASHNLGRKGAIFYALKKKRKRLNSTPAHWCHLQRVFSLLSRSTRH